jgi:FkbM family methyltransferase
MATAPASSYRHTGALESLAGWLRRFPAGRGRRTVLKRMYYATLMMRTLGRGLRSELPGGEVVYISPEHRYLSWNPTEYAAFRAAVRPGAVALDVGANVGAYALLLAQWAGPSGVVYAFEPAPDAFDGLRRHLVMNRVETTVTAVRAAVGDAPSHAPFVIGGAAGHGRLAAALDGGEQTVAVPVTTIDEFCAREGVVPDFIKIDVEGSETAVLRGARDTLARCRARAAVFVEVHPSIWPHIGTDRAALEDELSVQQLTLAPLVPMNDWLDVEGMCLRVVPR